MAERLQANWLARGLSANIATGLTLELHAQVSSLFAAREASLAERLDALTMLSAGLIVMAFEEATAKQFDKRVEQWTAHALGKVQSMRAQRSSELQARIRRANFHPVKPSE